MRPKPCFVITIVLVGLSSLNYTWGDSGEGANPPQGDGPRIEVLADTRAPGGLHAVLEGESVRLSWIAPGNREGLLGYVVCRDDQVITDGLVAGTTYAEAAPAAGLHRYKVGAFYSNAELYFGEAVDCYVFLRAGGSGTAQDPFLIATARQLIELAQHPDYMNRNFKLVSDIDLDPNLPGRKVFAGAVLVPDTSDAQLGFQGKSFTGVFDGDGHTISNLTIAGDSFLGLFGALGSAGRVMNLKVVDVDVTGEGSNIGAIAGMSDGTMQRCSSSGLVMGYSDVGGLVGSHTRGQIIESHSQADLVGMEHVGGLVGSSAAAVQSSNATGSVFGWYWAGGLVGFNKATISKCFAGGFVSGSSFLGGLAGYNDTTGLLSNCYACGMVQGQDMLGGLVGGNAGSLCFTYSTGQVVGVSGMGGLVGKAYPQAKVTASFWDREVSGQPSSAGGTGLTTAALRQVNTYVDAGWDFAGESANGTENIWYLTSKGHAAFFSFAGSGTEADPYLIETVWHLTSIDSNPNLLNKHFKLTQPIDLDPNQLGSRVFTAAVIAPDMNPSTASYDGVPFSGTLDGCGYEIRHLHIVGSGHLGLFGALGSGAHVRNVRLVLARIEAAGATEQGILAGTNEGHVTNCEATGLVEGGGYTGGLIGSNLGQVEACGSMADIQGKSYAGGLIGMSNGQVNKCYCTGKVTSSGTAVGGLLGENAVGHVANCYSTGAVIGKYDVGGLVGSNTGTIGQCYSIGAVTGTGYVGGLVGRNIWSVIDCFWNMETSGQSRSAGGLGLTTAQMQDINTYLSVGWDFFGRDPNGMEGIWIMNLYPVHYPVRIPGQGTEADPYLISNSNALVVLRNIPESSAAHYRLTEDIDLAGVPFSGPVIPRFSGTFDGGGYTIRHLTLVGGDLPFRGDDTLGLFGTVGAQASILNLNLAQANVQCTGGNCGLLAGVNEGQILHCSSSGQLSWGPLKHHGGLVGRNLNRIEQCFSNCTISSDGPGLAVGGLVGGNNGTIASCYSLGAINGGGQNVGGLVGFHQGSITNSYSATHLGSSKTGGLVGGGSREASFSFWDIEASGQTRSNGGTGLTTAEMQTASTFLAAGWDFLGEAANGTEDIWWISEGKGYPRLWWEPRN